MKPVVETIVVTWKATVLRYGSQCFASVPFPPVQWIELGQLAMTRNVMKIVEKVTIPKKNLNSSSLWNLNSPLNMALMISVKLHAETNMNRIADHWSMGDWKNPKLARLVENPPVDTVVKAWQIASNSVIPPSL